MLKLFGIGKISELPIEDNIDFPKRNVLEEKKEESKPEEEWIWVEGFKGTDENMQCYDKFQYELGKEYSTDEEIACCKKGFHLCGSLLDVVENYYGFDFKNRFFKCKAYVKKMDYARYGSYEYLKDYPYYGNSVKITKIVAKKIILTEELSYEYFKEEKWFKNLYPIIKTVEDYNICIESGSYELFLKEYFIMELISYGYSSLFAELLYESIETNPKINSNDNKIAVLTKVKVFELECMSKDMKVYLLLKLVKQI